MGGYSPVVETMAQAMHLGFTRPFLLVRGWGLGMRLLGLNPSNSFFSRLFCKIYNSLSLLAFNNVVLSLVG